MTYYKKALELEGAPYVKGGMSKSGTDCSGVVNYATGQTKRVWSTSSGAPPGRWNWIKVSKEYFFEQILQGDLLVWPEHCAFYAGNSKLFHARRSGTIAGFTSDLKNYWLKEKRVPIVYREI
jgi:cell wall-associated NlpC family hydrolase